jgi:hypothetical protein
MPPLAFAEGNGRSVVRCVSPDPPQSTLIGVRIGVNGCNLHLKLAGRVVHQAVAHDDVHAALAVVCE